MFQTSKWKGGLDQPWRDQVVETGSEKPRQIDEKLILVYAKEVKLSWRMDGRYCFGNTL